jgi:spore maturation protein CgeB
MDLVVFGLSVSSSWGNGHATLWRGLCRALGAVGHRVTFFERDVPYYAAHRDLRAGALPGLRLCLYRDLEAIWPTARGVIAEADAVIVTSFCPDGAAIAARLTDGAAGRDVRLVYYDLDTPVTLERLARGEPLPDVPADGLGAFDLVLSFTGGPALAALQRRLGARRVAVLYGSVDPSVHSPAPPPRERALLGYLGTYAADRQDGVERLFLAPARARPRATFLLAGAQYPPELVRALPPNVRAIEHLAPDAHAAFYAAARVTLNVTRRPMAEMGFCPSGRLFEAAACGAPILTDTWPGLETLFTPGEELLVARTTDDALAALDRDPAELAAIGAAARRRVLAAHTHVHRARELIALLSDARDEDRPAHRAAVVEEHPAC